MTHSHTLLESGSDLSDVEWRQLLLQVEHGAKGILSVRLELISAPPRPLCLIFALFWISPLTPIHQLSIPTVILLVNVYV